MPSKKKSSKPVPPSVPLSTRFALPHFVDNITLAFSADVRELLPPYEELSEEFTYGRHPWCRIVSDSFFNGFPEGLTIKPELRESIANDGADAWRHVMACLRSYQPKHEHKIAGVAYLMHLWFELPSTPSTHE